MNAPKRSDSLVLRVLIYAVIASIALIGISLLTMHERSLRMKAEAQVVQLTADKANLMAIAEVREQLLQTDERELGAIAWCLSESPTPLHCARWTVEAFDVP